MAVVAFFSAKGAPGVTTTAMLTASLWPTRTLLVDADASGGDVGLRLSSTYGRPLNLDRGLLTLLPLARRHLDPSVLLAHSQTVAGGAEVVAGLAGPDQAAAAGPLWANLGDACADLTSHDVVLDIGRLSSRSSVLPLVQAADLAVCIVPASLSGVVHARERLRALQPLLARPGGLGPRIGVLARAMDERADERDVGESLQVLQNALPDLLFLGWLPHDPDGAGIFDGRPVGRPERTMLVRAATEVVARMLPAGRRQPLGPPAAAPPVAGPGPAASPAATGRGGGGRRRAVSRGRSGRKGKETA